MGETIWQEAEGVVSPGHRVASGACGDPRFPEGTIAPQLPFFRAAVPGLEEHLGGAPYPGTINLRLAGRTVRPGEPETVVRDVPWTRCFPPETFFLSRCWLRRGEERHPAFLYIPDPATKPDHFQATDTVELLCRFIPDLPYGTPVRLIYPAAGLSIA